MAYPVDRKHASAGSNDTIQSSQPETDSLPNTPKAVKWSSTPQAARDKIDLPKRLSSSAGEPRTQLKSRKIRTHSDSNLILGMSRLQLDDTPQGSPIQRALQKFDWSEDKKSELLTLLRQPRQELETIFSSITDPHQELTLVQLIPLLYEQELDKNEEQTYLRTEGAGTLAWTAYMRCKLKKIFTGNYELSTLAQQHFDEPPTCFWRAIIARLQKSADALKYVLALNNRICQILATRDKDPEKIVVIALALQYFIPEVMVCGKEHKELLAYAPTLSILDKESDLTQQLKWLFVAKPSEPCQVAFLHYDGKSIDDFHTIIKLFNIPSDPQIKLTLPILTLLNTEVRTQILLDLLERDFAKLDQTLWLNDQTAGTVAWRWYVTYELSAIFPQSHFRVGDMTIQKFWKRSIELLKMPLALQKCASLASVNRKIFELLSQKTSEAKTIFLRGFIGGYFVHEILEENKSSFYSTTTLNFAKQLKRSMSDPKLSELFALLT